MIVRRLLLELVLLELDSQSVVVELADNLGRSVTNVVDQVLNAVVLIQLQLTNHLLAVILFFDFFAQLDFMVSLLEHSV